MQRRRWGRLDILHGGLGNWYSSAVQILLQSLVELIESAQLQFCHALLLATAGVVCANLVRCGHGGGIMLIGVGRTKDRWV